MIEVPMKRILIFSIVSLVSVAGMAQTPKDRYVEVIYFHGRQRCATCRSVERLTREVIETDMAEWVKRGMVRFREVDISTSDGAKLAEKYRVSWSSLYVNRWENGVEKRNDMTRFGFQHARNNSELFKKELKQKIGRLLE